MIEVVNQQAAHTITRAEQFAGELQFKKAFVNLLILPLYTPGWIVGRTVWVFKFLLGIVVMGFRDGAGVRTNEPGR